MRFIFFLLIFISKNLLADPAPSDLVTIGKDLCPKLAASNQLTIGHVRTNTDQVKYRFLTLPGEFEPVKYGVEKFKLYKREYRPEVAVGFSKECETVDVRNIVYKDDRIDSIEITSPLPGKITSLSLNPPFNSLSEPLNGTTVAFIDSGINYILPDISKHLRHDKSGNAVGYDFANMDRFPFDADLMPTVFWPRHHGTQVASVLVKDNNIQIAPYIYPLPQNPHKDKAINMLFDDLNRNNIRIALITMGSKNRGDWIDLERLINLNKQILFVIAAGNQGIDLDMQCVYPACFNADNILKVASANNSGAVSRFSNWGRTTVDVSILAENISTIDFTGKEKLGSGSSFAAPKVAAMAAKILEKDPDATPEKIKKTIYSYAHCCEGGNYTKYGYIKNEEFNKVMDF